MKALSVLAMLAMARAGFAGSLDAQAVTVCTESLPLIGLLAESRASTMFAAADVRIDWRSARSCPAGAIRVRFTNSSDPLEFPGAFAYALPYEGTTIVIFYDRLQQCSACAHSAGRSAVLAHVLVHEITHILQGFAGHSAEGVMKATFTFWDLSRMSFAPLPFTSTDLYLLHRGLASREAHPLASR